MRILMLASEVSPFAKTGGLADVLGALPQALARAGHDVRIMMPLYSSIDRFKHHLLPLLPQMIVRWGNEEIVGEVMRCSYPCARELPVYFIQQDQLFGRSGFYGENGHDYGDNDRRFSFFNLASLYTLKALDWQPDIIHLHDWQAGLAAVLLKYHPVISNDQFYQHIRTVFTIHNMAYQGIVSPQLVPNMHLPWSVFTHEGMEFHQKASFLKAGLVFSTMLTTVSPNYAREIQTEDFGAGMDGVTRERADDLIGIQNGVDTVLWNPSTDPHLPAHYAVDDLSGKAKCKKALLELFDLKSANNAPVIGMVSRLVDQKGFDLVETGIAQILSTGARFVLIGTGEKRYEQFFENLALEYPGQVGVIIRYSEEVAHLIEAGSDIFLMPSFFEPSGLNQLYSMRYGSLPIVRRVGGLADSVVDATPENIKNGTATGFVFDHYLDTDLIQAVERALTLFEKDKKTWKSIQETAMQRDHSWEHVAEEYEKVYDQVIKRPR